MIFSRPFWQRIKPHPRTIWCRVTQLRQMGSGLWSWVVTLATSMLMLLANFASSMLTSHLLEPTGRGLLAAAILWPSLLASLLVFGLNDAVLYFIAGRRLSTRQVWYSIFVMSMGLTLLGLGLGYAVLPSLLYQGHPELLAASRYILVLIPPMLIGTIFVEFLRARGRLLLWNGARILNAILYPVMIYLFYEQGLVSPSWFVLAFALSQIPTMMIGLIFGGWQRETGLLNPPVRWGWTQWGWTGWRTRWAGLVGNIKQIGMYGWKIHVGSMLSVVAQRIDQMLVALWLVPSELGLWVVALSLSAMAGMVSNSLNLLVWPRLAAAKPGEREIILALALRATLLLTALTGGMIALVSPWILGWFFGPGFRAATPLVGVLCLSMVPMAGRDLLSLAFKASDRSLVLSQNETLNLVTLVAVFALFIPLWGLTGAALAMLLVRSVAFISLVFLAERKLSLPLSRLFFPQFQGGAGVLMPHSAPGGDAPPATHWWHKRMEEGKFLLRPIKASPPE